jgi:hypothetical protein
MHPWYAHVPGVLLVVVVDVPTHDVEAVSPSVVPSYEGPAQVHPSRHMVTDTHMPDIQT